MQLGVPTRYVDITDVLATTKPACSANASQNPDDFYPLQDTVAHFRGAQSGYQRAEAYNRVVESPHDIFPMLGLAVR
jgi:hypothetical protein